MNLKLFFAPVEEHLYDRIDDPHSFCENIRIHKQDFPDLEDVDIALIGLTENRGTYSNSGVSEGANAIREKLYNLKKGFGRYRILDLGNLQNGVSAEDTCLRIKEVCHYLMSENILPVLFGGSQDLNVGQFLAYERMDKLVTMLNVDAFVDIDFDESKGDACGHLNKILLHKPNYLLHYTQLGHQSYLCSRESLDVLDKLFFDMLRLGHIRQHIAETEPYIRDADFMSFDISAIRSSDACGNANAQPFGLTGEEACQLCWYAGINDKLSSAGFYEYNPLLDTESRHTAAVVATMMWYFVEGFYHRRRESDFKSPDYQKFMVSIPHNQEPVIFYRSLFTDKWWLEVPNDLKRPYPGFSIIPCSLKDYETALNGQLPERYLLNAARSFS